MKRCVSITCDFDLAIGKVNLNEIVYRLKEIALEIIFCAFLPLKGVLKRVAENYFVKVLIPFIGVRDSLMLRILKQILVSYNYLIPNSCNNK